MNTQVQQYRSRNRSEQIIPTMFGLSLIVALIIGMFATALKPALAAASSSKGGQAEVQAANGTNSVVAWNAIALRTSIEVAGQNQPQSQMYLAPVQAAVYNAVVAVEGRYEMYRSDLAPRPGASVDAAVAAAAHAILVHYFPAQQAALGADYAASLAAIDDGPAKDAGIEVGQEAAAEIIALRQNDGLEADIGFSMPAPAPGVWQLPSNQTPLSPWISRLRPYLIESPNQFRPGPPPELDSPEWAAELEEVRLMGRKDNSGRSPEQTNVAWFWTMHAPLQHNKTLQQFALARGLDEVESARLFAMGDLVGADALIACFDAKYHYLFWRPVYAIPALTDDDQWLPLLGTPNHPEYTSAHSCVTTAMAEVYAAFLGTQRIDLYIKSKATNGLEQEHYYKYAHDLVEEIINARVWGGIHYRESNVKGAVLGRKVAHWALKRYFLPTGSKANQADAFGLESLWLPFLNR